MFLKTSFGIINLSKVLTIKFNRYSYYNRTYSIEFYMPYGTETINFRNEDEMNSAIEKIEKTLSINLEDLQEI